MSTYKGHLTVAEHLVLALRRDIEMGVLSIGTPLRQEEIASKYQVSRMPVREALRLLETEGLVSIYPGRGAFVTVLNAETIREVYEIRALLEGEALRHAFPNLTKSDLEEAELLLRRLEHVTDSVGWSTNDEAFHMTLYKPSQRPQLLQLINTLRRRVNHFYYLAHTPDQYREACQKEHQQIVAACYVGDSLQAVEALKRHLYNAGAVVAYYSEKLRDG